jgi:hypothetical protein
MGSTPGGLNRCTFIFPGDLLILIKPCRTLTPTDLQHSRIYLAIGSISAR